MVELSAHQGLRGIRKAGYVEHSVRAGYYDKISQGKIDAPVFPKR